MRIGICDDDKYWLAKANHILKEHYSEKEVSIDFFQTREDLLAEITQLDIIYMDIELKEDNGITLVNIINERNPDCFVVYLTNYLYYATDVYETNHNYYVLKEQFEEKLDAIDEIYRKRINFSQNKLMLITVNKEMIVLPIRQILYLERSDRKTYITAKDKKYVVKDKIEVLNEKLKDFMFIRSHKSFLINPQYVKEMKKDHFLMADGISIPISQRNIKSSKAQFLNWATFHMI